MSLRLRLIVVFFLLSVVPLAAVTYYSYTSNVRAVRDAATRESDLLAGELSQRMQLVTAQLSERVEHLMDLQSMQASAAATRQAAAKPAPAKPAVPTAPPPAAAAPSVLPPNMDQVYEAKVAQALGEAAMLLNNVELRGLTPRGDPGRQARPPSRGGGSGESQSQSTTIPPTPPGVTPPPRPAAPVGPTAPPANIAPMTPPGGMGGQHTGSGGRSQSARSRSGGAGGRGANANVPVDQTGSRTSTGTGAGTGIPSSTGTRTAAASGAAAVDAADAASRLMIDLAPIRREILKQIVPDGHLENLTPEERARIGRELNQRMLGIAQGLQLGAAGLQKRAADAEREAQATGDKAVQMSADAAAKSTATKAKAAEGTKAVERAKPTTTVKVAPVATPTPAPEPTPAATPPPIKKKTELSGSHLGVVVEQNGQVVEQISAEINLPQLLATVFSTTRRDRGEVPFAIGKDGKIYTPTDGDRKTIEGLNLPAPPDKQTLVTVTKGDWIVVQTEDPSGSGLRLGIAKPVADLVGELRKTAARNASLGLGFIGLALVAIVPLSGRLTRNLSKLTEGVDRISHGDYSARVRLKTSDEVGRLATAFNQMAADVEEHQRAAVGQERVRRELELGRQIQHEMLPHEPLRLGLTEIKGVSVPALEVGGDFFNYFELSDHRVALLVGDVSGKGVGAALLMANIQASLRTRLALGQDLSAIAEAIDHDVDANSPGPVYATLFVGILDPTTRRLQYVNAGHHPQYAICKQGLERMESTGLPVGLLSGHGYTAREVQLTAGDLLFFYTDGCVEASNLAGDMFGAERLEALLTAGGPMSPEDVLLRVEQAVKTFRGAAEPFDDETMMAVRVG